MCIEIGCECHIDNFVGYCILDCIRKAVVMLILKLAAGAVLLVGIVLVCLHLLGKSFRHAISQDEKDNER